MHPRPKSVRSGDDYTLRVTFQNGEERVYDMKPWLPYPLFQPLHNPVFFNTVKTDGTCVFWNDDIDLCPDTLYEKSIPVESSQDIPAPDERTQAKNCLS